MTRRRPDLDFRLLGHAIQHTRMFESLLIKRFPSKPDFNFDKVSYTESLCSSILDLHRSSVAICLGDLERLRFVPRRIYKRTGEDAQSVLGGLRQQDQVRVFRADF